MEEVASTHSVLVDTGRMGASRRQEALRGRLAVPKSFPSCFHVHVVLHSKVPARELQREIPVLSEEGKQADHILGVGIRYIVVSEKAMSAFLLARRVLG